MMVSDSEYDSEYDSSYDSSFDDIPDALKFYINEMKILSLSKDDFSEQNENIHNDIYNFDAIFSGQVYSDEVITNLIYNSIDFNDDYNSRFLVYFTKYNFYSMIRLCFEMYSNPRYEYEFEDITQLDFFNRICDMYIKSITPDNYDVELYMIKNIDYHTNIDLNEKVTITHNEKTYNWRPDCNLIRYIIQYSINERKAKIKYKNLIAYRIIILSIDYVYNKKISFHNLCDTIKRFKINFNEEDSCILLSILMYKFIGGPYVSKKFLYIACLLQQINYTFSKNEKVLLLYIARAYDTCLDDHDKSLPILNIDTKNVKLNKIHLCSYMCDAIRRKYIRLITENVDKYERIVFDTRTDFDVKMLMYNSIKNKPKQLPSRIIDKICYSKKIKATDKYVLFLINNCASKKNIIDTIDHRVEEGKGKINKISKNILLVLIKNI